MFHFSKGEGVRQITPPNVAITRKVKFIYLYILHVNVVIDHVYKHVVFHPPWLLLISCMIGIQCNCVSLMGRCVYRL